MNREIKILEITIQLYLCYDKHETPRSINTTVYLSPLILQYYSSYINLWVLREDCCEVFKGRGITCTRTYVHHSLYGACELYVAYYIIFTLFIYTKIYISGTNYIRMAHPSDNHCYGLISWLDYPYLVKYHIGLSAWPDQG